MSLKVYINFIMPDLKIQCMTPFRTAPRVDDFIDHNTDGGYKRFVVTAVRSVFTLQDDYGSHSFATANYYIVDAIYVEDLVS